MTHENTCRDNINLNDEIKKISTFRKKVNISAKISELKEFS
jgi:hypothetical protein